VLASPKAKSLTGVRGLSNWQWLFLLEALPSLVLGIVTAFVLPNGIRVASWLAVSGGSRRSTSAA
jgi:hypothetical protein